MAIRRTRTCSKRSGPIHTVTNTWETNRDILATQQNKVGTDIISKYDYSVNALGQRTGVNTSGIAFPAVPTWLWGYDSFGQVTRADSSLNTSDRAYQYDAIGNRKKSADSLTLPSADNYTANALNQYSVTPVSAVSPIYDFDGNMTSGPLPVAPTANSTLVWDAENRLTSTTVGTTTTSYLYDAQSRRISKSSTINNQLSTINYLYDGWNCIAEHVGTTLSKTNLWGTDLSGSPQGAGGVGSLLSETQITSNPITSNSFFPTYDGNGNVSEYLASNGTVAAHFEYDPFGRTVVNTNSTNQFAYRFSTKPIDVETGLYYYGYRYYDQATGRWPSRDPIGEKGGINLYGFVGNGGVGLTDSLGLFGYSALVTKDGISKQTNLTPDDIAKINATDWKGHGDFYGYGKEYKGKCYNGKGDEVKSDETFDWTRADNESAYKNKHPYHFLDFGEAMKLVKEAISKCDKLSFELYMHSLQDSFVHKGQGHKVGTNEESQYAWHKREMSESQLADARYNKLSSNPDITGVRLTENFIFEKLCG